MNGSSEVRSDNASPIPSNSNQSKIDKPLPLDTPVQEVASAGDKPWEKVADRLWITGNTYVLQSKTGDGIFVLDPWGQRFDTTGRVSRVPAFAFSL